MADIPTEALEAATRAELLALVSTITEHTVGCICQWCEDLRALAPHLIAEGRRQAAEAIRAADTAEWGPKRWLVPDVRDCQESAARIAEGTG